MLFRDGDVEVAVGIFPAEAHQAGAFAHRRRDAQQLRFGGGHVAQPVAEDIGVGRLLRAALADQALLGIERAHRVVTDLVALGQLVALALGGQDVEQLRTLEGLQRLQCAHERLDIVAVDRSGVVEAHLFEQGGRHEHALPVLFPSAHEAGRRLLLVAEQLLAAFAQRVERAAAAQPAQHLGQTADVLGDRHLVVVEDHQQVGFGFHAAGMVERFERHAGRHRAVADHRHHLAVVALLRQRDGHAQRGGDRGGGMPHAEGVVLAFLALGERRHAVLLLDRMDGVAAAGEDLVRIALVADIPHEPVVRRLVQVVQRHGQLDDAQSGAEVATAAAHRLDQVAAQLLGDGGQFGLVELAQVGRDLDPGQAGIAGGVDHRAGIGLARYFPPLV